MDINTLRNLKLYIKKKEAQGGVVSDEIKNFVKFKKLYTEEDYEGGIENDFLCKVYADEFDRLQPFLVQSFDDLRKQTTKPEYY